MRKTRIFKVCQKNHDLLCQCLGFGSFFPSNDTILFSSLRSPSQLPFRSCRFVAKLRTWSFAANFGKTIIVPNNLWTFTNPCAQRRKAPVYGTHEPLAFYFLVRVLIFCCKIFAINEKSLQPVPAPALQGIDRPRGI